MIMSYFAAHAGQRFSASAIADAEEIDLTLPTVSKLLKKLAEAGLLKGSRGVAGGYELAKSASTISVADIVTAIDGAPSITECSTHHDICDKACSTLKTNWQLINQRIHQVLEHVSLADMQLPYLGQQEQTIQFVERGVADVSR